MDQVLEQKLKNFLNLFWLRPENGLLCTFKSKVFDDVEFKSPSLDISCADGLFLFLHLGGTFNIDFDIFASTRAGEFKHSSFIDIYDSYDKNYRPSVIKRPEVKAAE